MPDAQNPNPAPTVAAPAPDADATAPGAARATNSEFNLAAPMAAGEVGALGPYRLVKELGRGGMGAVYLAVDTRLNRKLALKVMLPELAANADAKERFVREARAAALVSHDNVLTVYEADERAGVPYIAMQLLSGCSLDEFLKKKGTPALHHVVRIATETALGLAAAHKLGLVHRDIKPANLWLESPNGRVKVLDFGLARPIDEQSELTKSGAIIGTPAYMSPEQARGRKVDARGDVFSLGAVLYRLLTGRTPFAGANVMEVLMALGSDEPTPIRELNPNVPEPLAVLVHRMLAKNPAARPQSAAEVARLLPLALAGGAPELSASAPAVVPLPQPMVVSISPENVFADLDAEYEPGADRTEALTQVSRPATGGKGPLLAVAAAVLLAAVAVGLMLALKGGPKPDDTAKTDPPPRSTGKQGKTGTPSPPPPPPPPPPKEPLALKPPKPWAPPAPVPVGASPFDKLDPNAIPPEDKPNWLPEGTLVAVAGTHSPRTYGPLRHARGFTISSDGSTVATGGEFSPLRVWDVKTQKLKFDLPALPEYADSAFTSDGRYIVTYHDGPNRYMRYDLADPTKPATEWPSTLPPQLKGMGFWLAPDGSRMVSQTHTHALAYDLTTKPAKVLAKLEIPWDWGSRVVSPSRDCTRLAMFRADPKGVVVFDVTADGPKEVFAVQSDSALIALSSDGSKLVTAHAGALRLWNLAAEKPFAGEFAPNTRGPIAFNPSGTRLVTQDSERGLRLWDTTQSPPMFLWDVPIPLTYDGAARVGFAGEGGNTLVALTTLGFVYFIDVSESKPKVLSSVAPTEPVGAELTIDGTTGRVVLGRASDHRLQVWDFARARPALTDQVLPAGTLARTPDLKSLMVWEGGRPVLHAPGKKTTMLPPDIWSVGSFTPDGRTYWAMTTGQTPGRFVRFDLSGPEPKETGAFERDIGHVHRISTVRNNTVAVCATNLKLSFWDATAVEPKLLSEFPEQVTIAAKVFPDGERLLKQGPHSVPEVWQLNQGWVKEWSGPGDHRLLSDVHPSGKLFAVYGGGEITVYHADTFAKVRTIPYAAGKYPPQKIEFAPDGRHLFVINSFNTVYVLRLNELLKDAKAGVIEPAKK